MMLLLACPYRHWERESKTAARGLRQAHPEHCDNSRCGQDRRVEHCWCGVGGPARFQNLRDSTHHHCHDDTTGPPWLLRQRHRWPGGGVVCRCVRIWFGPAVIAWSPV